MVVQLYGKSFAEVPENRNIQLEREECVRFLCTRHWTIVGIMVASAATTALVFIRRLSRVQIQYIAHREGLGIGKGLVGRRWHISWRGLCVEEAIQVVGDPVDGVTASFMLPAVQTG